MRVGPSQDEIRRQNLGALLRHVHVHGATSRAELTTTLGLNRSTIGALTADLAGAGLVSEGTPKETGRAGRPSLVVRPESARVYAYSIEVDRLRAARVGLGGEILDRRDLERPRGLDAGETAPLLAGALKEMHQSVPAGALCVGAGVAVCGMVRRADGLVRLGPTTGWVDEPIGAALADELGIDVPITVGNVADVAAFAEHARGVAAGCDNVIYLYGDVGVGAGIIAGGRRVTGHGGYGGEVGHMVVVRDGARCECGSRGCWETEIGEYGLLRAAGRSDARGREALLALFDAADRGDARAQTAVRQAGDWLGFGVGNLVNIFNPEMVIFGGTMRDLYLAAAAQVRSRLNQVGLPACLEHVRLRTPKLGEDAALVGAAELAFERLLADPLDVG
ncbi:ROK family protein [Micromonospora halophytica]|uniref:Sugar kinase of the NBD/HSP70 family, may contain an N-terminal HTH domain n=1 Tax=Micromonospora halophytica TaxID=47864 RepID=A0A1C5GLJ1_9ACTN|nr:ROK family protein [Micromonospora halophytica]SCG34457.1 Sugar kinase of the NBD/HSP70 family, may contain an N-terminal HTH domain [Micromonospora halophytica]